MDSTIISSNFSNVGSDYVDFLEKQGRHSSAHIYRQALGSFHKFTKCNQMEFHSITAELLKDYEQYLLSNGASANTISTYLRMLRSIYNRGVDAQVAPYRPRLFHKVYTGIDSHRKRALGLQALHRLLYGKVESKVLKTTQLTARLMFQLCGIPFADLARLTHENIQGSLLSYKRKKTGISITIELLPSICQTLNELEEIATASSQFLLHILPPDINKYDSPSRHKFYTSALRRFNRQLKFLSEHLDIGQPVSSYTLRHSWATLAKHQGSPIEAISEMLGHTSIKTTQIYLKGFDLNILTKVNQRNCDTVALGSFTTSL